jgi:insertion element IS1 protein InsB
LWATKTRRGGYGTRSITTQAASSRTSWGRRADQVLLALKARLAPFGITRYYSDKWAAYQRHLPPEQHTVGKRYLQKIERKHLTFRTRLKRLARQTLCFSRAIVMHDAVIGLFMNRYEFGIAL